MSSPFNETRYKELLEGLEVVELSSKEFRKDNFEYRLDSEYFSKINLEYLKQLDKIGYRKIGDFSYVTDGIHTSIDYSETSNINLLSATSPRENYFDLSRKAFISEIAHTNNPRTALKENDIIISTVGTIGNCAVVTKSILPANSDRHVGIIRSKSSFLPNYISTFLLTKFGRFQTWRESTGNVQLNLFLYRIKTLKIANLTKEFQLKIDDQIKLAQLKIELSKQKYHQAETLLLETLGLRDFQPSTDPINVKGFKESFLSTGRLDAEYYQRKYEEVISHITAQKYDCLANIVTIKKSIEPGSDVYSEEGVPFLRVADFNKFGINVPEKKLNDAFCKENKELIEKLKPKKETILFSKDGSVGTAYMLRNDSDFITSGAMLHLKVKDKKQIIPEYLTLALNSKLVQMQAERDAGGSIILHWRVGEIENVVVPIIDYTKQQEIAELVEESYHLKKQSEHLLETAKRAVEIAIEEGEEVGLEYIINIKKKNELNCKLIEN